MTIEDNKRVIDDFRSAQADGDPLPFLASSYRHFMAGDAPFGWDHLALEEIYASLDDHASSPITVKFGPMIAEGDSVVEEAETFAELDDGTIFHNWHCFVHDLRDGQIIETREYLDTLHVWVALARWSSWGAVPTPAPRRIRPVALPNVELTVTLQGAGRSAGPRRPPEASAPGPGFIATADTLTGRSRQLVEAMHESTRLGGRNTQWRFEGEHARHFRALDPFAGGEQVTHASAETHQSDFFAHLMCPIVMQWGPMIAEGERVVRERETFAAADDISVYNNYYLDVYEIVDGRVVERRNYQDSRHVWAVLGRSPLWPEVKPPTQRRPTNLPKVRRTIELDHRGVTV